jgi:REase_DpnII-MboI
MAAAVSSNISDILDGLDRCRHYSMVTTQPSNLSRVNVQSVLYALQSFSEIVRYLNTRRSRGAILVLEDEAAVQDVLYIMLRPWVHDLTPENPTDKIANTYSIKDFVSHTNKFVLEAKYVRDDRHGKSIVGEINDDIETYRYHSSCDDLIFFIYDPNSYIPDSAAVTRHLQTSRTYGTKVLRCHGVIKP